MEPFCFAYPDRWTDFSRLRFEPIQEMNLKSSSGWRVKQDVKGLFPCTGVSEATIFLEQRYHDAVNTDIREIKGVARIFLRQINRTLNIVLYRSINALIESIKSIMEGNKYGGRG